VVGLDEPPPLQLIVINTQASPDLTAVHFSATHTSAVYETDRKWASHTDVHNFEHVSTGIPCFDHLVILVANT